MRGIGAHTAPLGRGRAALAELVAFCFAVALAGVSILDEVGPHDEGLILAAAGRVAAGQLPYRDFWWNYGPGEPVLLAGLVQVFGPSLLAWRIVRVLAGGAVAVLCLRLARRHGVGERWALAAGLTAGSAVAWPLTPGPTVFALVPALGALVVAAGARGGAHGAGRERDRAARVDDRARPAVTIAHAANAGGALLAGALAGLAAWLRPELGVAAVLGVLLAGGRAGRSWRDGLAIPRSWRDGLATARGPLGAFAATTAVLYLPFVLADPGAFADDMIGFLGIQGMQRLPFPLEPPGDPNKAFEALFPAVLVLSAAVWAVLARGRPLLLAPAALAGLAYLLARTDEFHLVPLAAVLAPALAIGAARTAGPRRAVLAVALGLIALHGLERQAGRLARPPALAAVPGGVGDGVRTTAPDAAALRALVPRVRALGRPVFVAPPRMDRVRVGDPLLNVILDLPNPTRHDVIQPGVVTTDAVQRELIADLARTRATVIRWNAPAATRVEENAAGRERGSRRFDTWVAARYRRAFAVGDYTVLVPR